MNPLSLSDLNFAWKTEVLVLQWLLIVSLLEKGVEHPNLITSLQSL